VRNEIVSQKFKTKGRSKNENCKQYNTDNETERDKKVPRKKEIPKINTVTVVYNGDKKHSIRLWSP
jgi:hypothetical protein